MRRSRDAPGTAVLVRRPHRHCGSATASSGHQQRRRTRGRDPRKRHAAFICAGPTQSARHEGQGADAAHCCGGGRRRGRPSLLLLRPLLPVPAPRGAAPSVLLRPQPEPQRRRGRRHGASDGLAGDGGPWWWSAQDWSAWEAQPLAEMDTVLAVQMYLQQLVRRSRTDVAAILAAPEGTDKDVWQYEHLRCDGVAPGAAPGRGGLRMTRGRSVRATAQTVLHRAQ